MRKQIIEAIETEIMSVNGNASADIKKLKAYAASLNEEQLKEFFAILTFITMTGVYLGCRQQKVDYKNAGTKIVPGLPLTTIGCRIGEDVAKLISTEDTAFLEGTEAEIIEQEARIGIFLLNVLFKLKIVRFQSSGDREQAMIFPVEEEGGEEIVKQIIEEVLSEGAVQEKTNSQWMPALRKPPVVDGFYNGRAGKLIKTNNQEIIDEVKENQDGVFDSIFKTTNKVMQVPYQINRDLLDVFNVCKDDSIFTFTDKHYTEQQLKSKTLEMEYIFKMANQLKDEERFWEYFNYDFRGRIYPSQKFFNHTGSKMAKALFQFFEKKEIGKDGYKWLLINAANHFGKDILALSGRVKFAKENLKLWLEIAANPYKAEHKEIWQKRADNPFEFMGAIIELQNAHECEEGVLKFKSGLPISIDQSCSGAQILGAWSHDEVTAKYVNTLKDKSRGDYYSTIAKEAFAGLRRDEEGKATFEFITKSLKELHQKKKDMEKSRYHHFNMQLISQRSSIMRRLNTLSKQMKEEGSDMEELSKQNKLQTEKLKSVVEVMDEFDVWEYKSKWEAIKKFKSKHKEDIIRAAEYFWSSPEIAAIHRKLSKAPCMVLFYSAGKHKSAEQMQNDWAGELPNITPEYSLWIVERIRKEATKLLKRPTTLMEVFKKVGEEFNSRDEDLKLYMPYTKFPFVQSYKKNKIKKVKFRCYDYYKGQVTRLTLSLVVGKDEKRDELSAITGSSPNITHAMDSCYLSHIILNCDFSVMPIHDSFAAAPSDMDALFKQCRTSFYELLGKDTKYASLDRIFDQIDCSHLLEDVDYGNYEVEEDFSNQFFCC